MGTRTARSRRADRHLRLGCRWADGRPGGARPAAARGRPLRRRHRARPLRPAADRRGAPALASPSWTTWSTTASRCSSSPATPPAPPACATPASATTSRWSRSILPAVRRAHGRHPQRAGRGHRHAGDRSPAAPTRTPSPPRRRSTVTSAACPSFVDFVERGVTSGRQLLGLAQSYLDPLLVAGVDTVVLGCTHYPLLTGVHLPRHGRRRDARLQRRGDREGRLPGADRGRPAARRGRRRRPSTASWPPATRSRSPASAAASSGPEVGSVLRAEHRWAPREAHRRRLLGQRPGPEVAGLQLPRRARRLPDAARPRQRRVRAAAGPRRPGRPSTRSSSPTCTPTTASTSRRSSCGTGTPGRSTRSLVPLYAPVGAERRLALAYDLDGDGLTDVFDFVPVGPGSFTLGPFEVTLARTAHPVECYAIRLTAGGRSLVYTGDTGPCERVVELARGRRRAAGRGGPPARSGPARRAAPHRPRGRRARRRGRASAGCC